MFDRSAISAQAVYAENEYAQAIEETGLIGFTFLALFIIGVWHAYRKNIRSENGMIGAASLGLGYGILAIMVHSLSDFGQHIPANAGLTIISSALLVSLSRLDKTSGSSPQHRAPSIQASHRLAIGIPAVIVVLLVGIWVMIGANRSRVAEAHWRAAQTAKKQLEQNNWQGMDSQYMDLLTHATNAAKHQPRNIEYQHWLNVYRWRSISRYTDPNTGNILIFPETPAFTQQIIQELHQARTHCPTYGQALSIIGELEHIVLNDPNGLLHIFQAYELAPCDPGVCFLAATMHAELGQKEQAYEKLRRTVELDGAFFRNAAHICVYRLSDPQLALELAGDTISKLSQVAQIRAEKDSKDEMVQEIGLIIKEKLITRSKQEDTPASVFASLAALHNREGDVDYAIENYQKALFLDHNQVSWRYGLAKLLQQKGLYEQAIREAKICLRLKPDYELAKQLIGDLSIAQTTNSIEGQSSKGPEAQSSIGPK